MRLALWSASNLKKKDFSLGQKDFFHLPYNHRSVFQDCASVFWTYFWGRKQDLPEYGLQQLNHFVSGFVPHCRARVNLRDGSVGFLLLFHLTLFRILHHRVRVGIVVGAVAVHDLSTRTPNSFWPCHSGIKVSEINGFRRTMVSQSHQLGPTKSEETKLSENPLK